MAETSEDKGLAKRDVETPDIRDQNFKAIVPFRQSENGLSTYVPEARFLGERIANSRLDISKEVRRFNAPGFVIELSARSTGSMNLLVYPSGDLKVRGLSVHGFSEAGKKAITAATRESLPAVINSLSREASADRGTTLSGEDNDLAVYFGHKMPSIFQEGPDKPPGLLKGKFEDNFGLVVVETPEGTQKYFIIRSVTRRVDARAAIGTGRVNSGDNVNAREILFVGYEEIKLEDLLDLYEHRRRSQEALINDRENWLLSASNKANGVVAATSALAVLEKRFPWGDRNFNQHIQEYKDIRDGQREVESKFDPITNIHPEIDQFFIGGFFHDDTGDERAAQSKMLEIALKASGSTRLSGSSGLEEILNQARMENTPIPGAETPTEIVKAAAMGKLVTLKNRETLNILDKDNPGVLYEVRAMDIFRYGRNDYEWTVRIKILDQNFIKQVVEAQQNARTEARNQLLIEAATIELRDLKDFGIDVSGHDVVVTDEELAEDMLVNGLEITVPFQQQLPCLIVINNMTVVLTTFREKVVAIDPTKVAQIEALTKAFEISNFAEVLAMRTVLDQHRIFFEISQQRLAQKTQQRDQLIEIRDALEKERLIHQKERQTGDNLLRAAESKLKVLELTAVIAASITAANVDDFEIRTDGSIVKVDRSDKTLERKQFVENNSILKPLNQGQFSIGRETHNDLVFNHPKVSREHAMIDRMDGNLSIKDVGSTNGTFVNGVQVSSRGVRMLEEGDEIRLGDTSFRFKVVDGQLLKAEDARRVPAVKQTEEQDISNGDSQYRRLARVRISEVMAGADYKKMTELKFQNSNQARENKRMRRTISELLDQMKVTNFLSTIKKIREAIDL